VRDDRNVTPGEFTNAHPALAEFWHPVALSPEVGREPVATRVAGQGWALARFGGVAAAFADACPHRRARLSAGQITDGTLQCMYHGWRFTSDGRCVDIPALEDTAPIPARAAPHRPAEVAERDGIVWLAPKPPRAPLPGLDPGVPPDGYPGNTGGLCPRSWREDAGITQRSVGDHGSAIMAVPISRKPILA
jgi:phenylpropionate dioxygenase-like ring-hydroxylating dioxygenase large terminal subunit